MPSTQRDFYTRQISTLLERLAAVESDLASASSSESQLTLEKRAVEILKQISGWEDKLDELDSKDQDPNVRDRRLEKTLQKIDFVEAKKAAGLIKEKLNQTGGSVLFLLRRSKRQMGRYCIEEVLDVIMAEQIIEGQIIGDFRRYSVDLGSAISHYNECEFLIRLASYFGLEASTDWVALSQQLRDRIRSSIDQGTTIFLEIKSLDDLLEQEFFLGWFIEEFWKPLMDEVVAVSQKYRSKFIVALIADSQILSDCSPDYFCHIRQFDCYKMLELPLPNWTVDDIQDWLMRFRTLSTVMKEKTDAELKTMAKKIHRDSEGTPESVCVSLREQF